MQEVYRVHLSCGINKGSPCSSLIPLDTYVYHRAEAAGLTQDQLDLVLIGVVMSVLNTNERTFVRITNPKDDNGYM